MSTINQLIATGIRPPDTGNIGEAAQRRMTLQQMARQGRMQDLQFREQERAIEAANQIQSLRRMGLTPEELRRETYAVDYKSAMALDKSLADQRKADVETQLKEKELRDAIRADLSKHAWALYNTPDEQMAAAWQPVRADLLATGRYGPEQLGDAPPDRNTLRVLGLLTLDPEKQTKILNDIEAEKRAKAAEAHNVNMRPLQVRSAQAGADRAEAEALGAQAVTAERFMPATSQEDWTAWRAELPASLQARISPMYSPEAAQRVGAMAMTRNEREAAQRASGQLAESRRHNLRTEALAASGQAESRRHNLATEETARNSAAGGAKLGEGAVGRIAEIESAIGEVEKLAKLLQDNSGYMGPVMGWRASALNVNPWDQDPKKVQASIDLIRQRVGKALEGGVLRKEDEEKYRKILPTMTDMPDVAQYKLRMLAEMMRRDLTTFVDTQAKAGRRVGGSAPETRVMTMADVETTARNSGRSVQEVIEAAKAKGYVVR
jgi:hypothetical protein